jgi:transcription elongation factor GreB
MSKAFTKEDAAPDVVVVPARAPLPAGVPNYVTARGLELLRAERRELELARAALERLDGTGQAPALTAWAARVFELEQRLSSAQLVVPAGDAGQVVRFGSKVTVMDHTGRSHDYEIVGVDEAEPASGRIAFLSPLAKALLGASVGEVVVLETPGKTRELEVVAVA